MRVPGSDMYQRQYHRRARTIAEGLLEGHPESQFARVALAEAAAGEGRALVALAPPGDTSRLAAAREAYARSLEHWESLERDGLPPGHREQVDEVRRELHRLDAAGR